MSHRVLSGIRATGRLHLGNLLGAVQHFVRFQSEGNTCLYFVANWHTLTTLEDPDQLRNNQVEIVTDYLAAGLNPSRSIIYFQSDVPELAELCLYLSMVQPLGELMRIPTFKEKVRSLRKSVKENPSADDAESIEGINLGLLTYPVLMAADILGPKATLVPVGEDQIPNVELAQSLARRFNSRFGETFVVPEMLRSMIKVPGLGGGKMGKSDADNAVDIHAPMDVIRDRYLTLGVTDPKRYRRQDPGDPYNGCVSIYPVHELVTIGETDTRQIANDCISARIGCVACKNRLVDSLALIIQPFQDRRAELAGKRDYVIDVIREGGKKARELIAPTVAEVRDKMGISLR